MILEYKRHFGQEHFDIIQSAIDYATDAHINQERESGEPYIVHPIAVAAIVMEMGLDVNTVVAALLHDVLEDTTAKSQDIEDRFGKEVLNLVDGVTKLESIRFHSKEEEQAENFRKMLFAMARDIRVILIKLADRLHNMRTAGSLPQHRKLGMAQETIEIYAPLASRLGLSYVKSELEDLYLKHAKPEDYKKLSKEIAFKIDKRKSMVEQLCQDIRDILVREHIAGEVDGRPKHFFSIYKKMQQQDKSLAEVFDLTAVRILVQDIKDCYSMLGFIHDAWTPIPMRFKDYISLPKANKYQSLHTTVMTEFGMPFEIQIRTYDMHKIAEYGIAAHWKYKEKRSQSNQMDDKIGWLRSIIDANSDAPTGTEFFDGFRHDYFADQIFVFTPKGDVSVLPMGSTPVDFAYSVHSAVGNKCVGSLVNGRMVPLNTALSTGDYIEILTQSNSKGPSRDWLKFVKSSQARSKIRTFFKKEMKEENKIKGKEMLEIESRQKGYSWAALCQPKWLDVVMNRQGINSIDDLYATVGYGGLTTLQVLSKLVELSQKDNVEKVGKVAKAVDKEAKAGGILIRGQSDLLVNVAKCCKPVPGDDIVGFISRGKGIAVHRTTCSNLKSVETYRLVEAEWHSSTSGFVANVQVEASFSDSLLSKVTTAISESNIRLRRIDLRRHKDSATILFGIEVDDASQANMLINKLGSMRDVYKAYRV